MRHSTSLVFLIALSALTVAASAFADDDCSPVRLDASGGSMATLPVYDQGSSDLCYAYTTSQMVDAWRFSHGDTGVHHLTSPVVAATHYAATDEALHSGRRISRLGQGAMIADNGLVPETYAAIRAHGSCDFETVDRFSQAGFNPKLPVQNPFAEFLDAARAEARGRACGITARPIPLSDDPLDQLNLAIHAANEHCAGHTISLASLPPEVVEFTHRDAQASPEGATRTMLSRLNARFSAPNPQPVGMSYCMNLLNDRSFNYFSPDGTQGGRCSDGKHVSVIAGRRPVTVDGQARCQYLLRNTFGPNCDNVDRHWGADCDHGEIWIDSEQIARNAYELLWISGN